MRFTKMEGLGNDYVYVNCFEECVEDPGWLARLVSDRHLGIGGDGLILIAPSDKANFSMLVYNSDGSRAEMCGNGIRCAGKYAYDHGLISGDVMTVETLAGIKTLRYISGDTRESVLMVDMGKPVIGRDNIPMYRALMQTLEQETVLACGEEYRFTRVSMGNPHAVIVVSDTENIPVGRLGPCIECDRAFPDRTNVEFVQLISPSSIRMRVWERGSGETRACGTGACAASVACMLAGTVDEQVEAQLAGGRLDIQYDRQKDTIYMTGPARTVFDGRIDIF